eukprot:COSAG02_NODE_3302_length_6981_cov_6.817640_5_plen_464_part_00
MLCTRGRRPAAAARGPHAVLPTRDGVCQQWSPYPRAGGSSLLRFTSPMVATRSSLAVLLLLSPARVRSWQTLLINRPTAVDSNRTIAADVSLRFEDGGSFVVDKDATLTIEGSLSDAPLQQIFSGAGTVLLGTHVPQVFPEWWGASAGPEPPAARRSSSRSLRISGGSAWPPPPPHPELHPHRFSAGTGATADRDDSLAIQAAIDSLMYGGEVRFGSGRYDLGSTGLVVGGFTTLMGNGAGSSRLYFSGVSGSAITLRPDTELFNMERLALRGERTQGFGINGTAHYVRYFSVRDFEVVGFSCGVYIEAGEHIHLGFGYMSAFATNSTDSKGAPGTFALKLGADGSPVETNNPKGCTTVTIESIYFTQADILIYTISAPQVIIRPIFEECRVAIQVRRNAKCGQNATELCLRVPKLCASVCCHNACGCVAACVRACVYACSPIRVAWSLPLSWTTLAATSSQT